MSFKGLFETTTSPISSIDVDALADQTIETSMDLSKKVLAKLWSTMQGPTLYLLGGLVAYRYGAYDLLKRYSPF